MFNDNKKLKLTSFNDNSSNYDNKSSNYEIYMKKNSNKGVTALKEIESLKSEIQNALKNNIVLLNNEDILSENNNNDLYNKEDKNKNKVNNFNGNQTGGFGNQIDKIEKEKDIEEINDYVNNNKSQNNNNNKKTIMQNERRVKDYQLNDKSSEGTNKRKPFDKFNFN